MGRGGLAIGGKLRPARAVLGAISEADALSAGIDCILCRIASRALAIAAGSASGGALRSGVAGGWMVDAAAAAGAGGGVAAVLWVAKADAGVAGTGCE